MRLYLIQFDGQPDYVEALNLSRAVAIWKRHMSIENDEDWQEEPESIALIHEKPVWREDTKP